MRRALSPIPIALLLACGGPRTPDDAAPTGDALFGPDGGLGAACVVDADCRAGLCDRTVPGGYCTAVCTDLEGCDEGACVSGFCMAECTSQRDCPTAEYECFDVGLDTGVCAFDLMRVTPSDPNVGAPCRADIECAAPLGLQPICIAEHDREGLKTGYTGGMCTGVGCTSDGECGAAGRCVGGPVRHCMPACQADADCRDGYVCDAPALVCAPTEVPCDVP